MNKKVNNTYRINILKYVKNIHVYSTKTESMHTLGLCNFTLLVCVSIRNTCIWYTKRHVLQPSQHYTKAKTTQMTINSRMDKV